MRVGPVRDEPQSSRGLIQILRNCTALRWSWSMSGPSSPSLMPRTPPGVGEISVSSMMVTPFWTTVTRAFFATLPSLDACLVEGDVVGLPLERRLAGVDAGVTCL